MATNTECLCYPQTAPTQTVTGVYPGRFLAGEYPGALCEAEARQKLARLLESGVTFFLDLTASHELQPYAALLDTEAQARGRTVVHRRLPIPDGEIPHTPQEMVTILDTIVRCEA